MDCSFTEGHAVTGEDSSKSAAGKEDPDCGWLADGGRRGLAADTKQRGRSSGGRSRKPIGRRTPWLL